ncbi:uncharacterized protein LOC143283233 isoform X2 [Babylonia areolata]|uniref:uncharacterized protein LOC143283233 isoform X2 n=1 Tax=Babylonia areolata TaxID=304850 RepID=UPI003FD2E5C9
MESDSEKDVNEPHFKRQRLDMENGEAASSSSLPKEPDDLDDAGSESDDGSTEDHQGGEVDRESVVSGDEFSELSNLSGLDDQCDEAAWLPVAGPIAWVQRQMSLGTDPRDVIQCYLGEDVTIPPDADQLNLWEMVLTLLLETTANRTKLSHINTMQDVVELLKKCQNIIVLTGAGVSVSCGIPDFRSQNGIYARLAEDFPDLPNPQSMFDINYFKSDQRPFFKFAKEIYPGQFEPSPCHKFIRLLETHGKLLRNYTQNIDTLEKVAGVERAIECHGSFATATCMVCKYKVDKEAIRKDIFDQVIPRCPQCGPDVEGAVMKPDIVFFGESLPDEFHRQMRSDKDVCDLLIVIGSSLKVRPVSRIPSSLPANVPQIIINREPLHKQYTFDVELLGNCDDVISELCNRLGEGWELLAKVGPPAEEVSYSDLPPTEPSESSCHSQEAAVQGKREDVVEHNADSGMGDLETGTRAPSAEGPALCSGSTSEGSGSSNGRSFRSSERLERLSSSDSGAESSTAVDTQGLVSLQPSVVALSKPHSEDVFSSSTPHQNNLCGLGSSCMEVSTQGICACDTRPESRTSQHTCPAERQSHCAEGDPSLTLHPSQKEAEAASGHNRQSAKTTGWHESLSTCQGPIERNVHPHSGCSAGCGGEKEDGEKEMNKVDSCFSSIDRLEMQRIWEKRKRQSIAHRCKDNQIIFISPNRYIFPGAEVYSDDSDDSDSDDSSHLSISPIPAEMCDDTEESQNTTNSCLSPSSSAPCDPAHSQGSSGHDAQKGSPCSTPPVSPFAASDDGQPVSSGDSQDKSELDADPVQGTERTKQ